MDCLTIFKRKFMRKVFFLGPWADRFRILLWFLKCSHRQNIYVCRTHHKYKTYAAFIYFPKCEVVWTSCMINIGSTDFLSLMFVVLLWRGNSKYHYYGIRVKPDSPLNRLQEDMQYMAMRQQPMQQKQR